MDTGRLVRRAMRELSCPLPGRGRIGFPAGRLAGSRCTAMATGVAIGKCTGSLFLQVVAALAVASAHHALLPALLAELWGPCLRGLPALPGHAGSGAPL